ncbi:MAG: type II toxin-antitoxin system RelE/ParE family toxin [Acidimicrobiales bacterium]
MAPLVLFHEDALAERERLQPQDRQAFARAVEKLSVLGQQLPFPHQSAVQGSGGLRELRPRSGRSRWRGIYARVGDSFVVLAVVPEAGVDRRGFDRGIAAARRRLQEVEGDG